MSLRWVPLAVLVLLLTPSATGQSLGQVDARAPLELHGDVDLSGPLVRGVHHAFEDGTMAGMVYRGTLVRLVHEEGQPPQRTVVAEADPDRPFAFALTTGTVATLAFPQGFRFFVGPSGLAHDAHPTGTPVAWAGPNPARTVGYDEDAGADPFLHMEVVPMQRFVVVPARGVNTTSPFLVTIEAGNLTFGPVDEDATRYESSSRTETRTTGVPLLPTTRQVRVLTAYELNATRVVYSLRQASADATIDYWTGDQPLGGTGDGLPHGHRPRVEASVLGGVLADHGLPATVLATDAPAIALSGVVRIHPTDAGSDLLARRGLTGGQVDVGGTLAITLDSPAEAQRRMKVDLGGTVVWSEGKSTAASSEQAWRAAALVAGGSIILAAGAVWSWPLLKLGAGRFLLVPLYARIHRDEVLEHPVRDDILTTVTREPGISATELGKRTACGWGTLVYHLSVLERVRLVWSAREGRHRRYFAQGRVNYSDRDALGLLRNPASRRLTEEVQATPGIIQRDLSRALDLAPSTVAWHVERLVRAGLLIKESDGRQVRYFPSQRLDALAHVAAAS